MSEPWRTFDAVAASYDIVRPDSPVEIFASIESFSGVERPRVLEVGIGSGQATKQMVGRGWEVVGVEPGTDLIALAAEQLSSSPAVTLVEAKFEDLELSAGDFDVVAAATAWHWVDPGVGYPKAARALRPRGILALWWNAHVTTPGSDDWDPIRDVYERIAPDLADLARLTPDRPDYDPAREVSTSGVFTDVREESYPFAVSYRAEQFVMLIGTYASHRNLEPTIRVQLNEALIETINQRMGGVVHKPYEGYLVLARKR